MMRSIRAGVSVMHYVRARRLGAAARALAAGAPDILNVALDSGYSSHEAFSRAFRAQFRATPESVRRQASTETLTMTPPMKAAAENGADLAAPRFEKAGAMLVVGLPERHAFGDPKDIPGQWRRFMASYEEIANKKDVAPYGATFEDGYRCAVICDAILKSAADRKHIDIKY